MYYIRYSMVLYLPSSGTFYFLVGMDHRLVIVIMLRNECVIYRLYGKNSVDGLSPFCVLFLGLNQM